MLTCSRAPSPTARTGPSPISSSDASPSPNAAAPLAIARNVDLFDPASGARLAHLDEAEVLELGFGGFRGDSVRVRTSMGVLVGDLRLPAVPAPGQGLGLYITKLSDILPTSPETGSAPLGRAYAGAFLPVREVKGDHAVVALPPFEIEGRVVLSALGLRQAGRPNRPAYTSLVENRRLRIRTSGGELETTCDVPVGILGEGAHGIEVAQYRDGIEIVGTAESGGEACPARVQYGASTDAASPSIPAGWQRVDRNVESRAFAGSAVFYWLERDGQGAPACVEWRFKAGKDENHDGTLVQRRRGSDPAHKALIHTSTYEVSGADVPTRAGAVVTLKGPTTASRTAEGTLVSSAGLLCAEPYALAGTTNAGLIMLRGISWNGKLLLAYHPDDAQIWYTNRRACQDHAERVRALPSSLVSKLLSLTKGGC